MEESSPLTLGLSKVALSLDDVPSGYVVRESTPVNNEKAAQRYVRPWERLEQYEKWGRQAGYEVWLAKKGGSAELPNEPEHIKNLVTSFSSGEGAIEAHESSMLDLISGELIEGDPNVSEVPMGEKIGDQSMAVQFRKKRGGIEFLIYIISFVYRNIHAGIITIGLQDRLDFGDAVFLAKRVEGKIKSLEVK